MMLPALSPVFNSCPFLPFRGGTYTKTTTFSSQLMELNNSRWKKRTANLCVASAKTLFTQSHLIFSDLAAPGGVNACSLRFRPHLPPVTLSLSSFEKGKKRKKNPVLFSTDFSALHPFPSPPHSQFLTFLFSVCPFWRLPPLSPVYNLSHLLVFSSPHVYLPVFPPEPPPAHPYRSHLPVGLLSMWKHDLQPSNRRLYTAAFSSCTRFSLWDATHRAMHTERPLLQQDIGLHPKTPGES